MPLITSQSVVRDLFRRGRSLCSGTHTADIKVSVTLETLGKNLLSLSLKCQKSPVCYSYRTAVPAFPLASAGSCFPFLVATSLPTLPFHLQASNSALDASCVMNIPDFSLCHKMEKYSLQLHRCPSTFLFDKYSNTILGAILSQIQPIQEAKVTSPHTATQRGVERMPTSQVAHDKVVPLYLWYQSQNW